GARLRGTPVRSFARTGSPASLQAADGVLQKAAAVFRRDLGGEPLDGRRGGQVGRGAAQLLGGEGEPAGDLFLGLAPDPLGLRVRSLAELRPGRLPFREPS